MLGRLLGQVLQLLNLKAISELQAENRNVTGIPGLALDNSRGNCSSCHLKDMHSPRPCRVRSALWAGPFWPSLASSEEVSLSSQAPCGGLTWLLLYSFILSGSHILSGNALSKPAGLFGVFLFLLLVVLVGKVDFGSWVWQRKNSGPSAQKKKFILKVAEVGEASRQGCVGSGNKYRSKRRTLGA